MDSSSINLEKGWFMFATLYAWDEKGRWWNTILCALRAGVRESGALRRANLPWSAPVTIRRRRGAKFAVRPQSEILLFSLVDGAPRLIFSPRVIFQRLTAKLLLLLLFFYTGGFLHKKMDIHRKWGTLEAGWKTRSRHLKYVRPAAAAAPLRARRRERKKKWFCARWR